MAAGRVALTSGLAAALAVACSTLPSGDAPGTDTPGSDAGSEEHALDPSSDGGPTVDGASDAPSLGDAVADAASDDASDASTPDASDASTADGGADAGSTSIPVDTFCAPPPVFVPDPQCPIMGQRKCAAPACVNLVSDENNCGACGNVCAAGEICAEATCVDPGAIVLPPEVKRPAAFDHDHLYYGDGDGLWQVDKLTFVRTQLSASTTVGTSTIAVDSHYVYWVTDAGKTINRTELAAGGATTVMTTLTTQAKALNVDADAIHWLRGARVEHMPKVPGAAVTGFATHANASNGTFRAVDDTHYYVATGLRKEVITQIDKRSGASDVMGGNMHGIGEVTTPGPTWVSLGNWVSGIWSIVDRGPGGGVLVSGSSASSDLAYALRFGTDACTRFYGFENELVRLRGTTSTGNLVLAKPAGVVTWVGADERWVYWEEDGPSPRPIRRVAKWTVPPP